MIEINLLPKERRRKKFKLDLAEFSFLSILAGLIIAIVVVEVLLSGTVIFRRRTVKVLKARQAEMLPAKEKLDELKKDIARSESRIAAVENLMKERLLWGEKLEDLAESITPEVWLTRLSLEEKSVPGKKPEEEPKKLRFLNLEGSTLAQGEEGTAAVGRFIRSLKDNKDFFSHFSEIRMDWTRRHPSKETEVMLFRLVCQFK